MEQTLKLSQPIWQNFSHQFLVPKPSCCQSNLTLSCDSQEDFDMIDIWLDYFLLFYICPFQFQYDEILLIDHWIMLVVH